jgi:hypothetical protein
MSATTDGNRGLFTALIGDGRPLLSLTGMLLIGFGLFALFLSAMGQFLPHDVDYLGMTAGQLCAVNECRVVHFMFHDRVAFGGTLLAVGTLYLWMAAFPFRRGEPWTWWLFVVSGVLGFASFLLYLGYGYLDTWHAIGTLMLFPCFAVGLLRTYFIMRRPVTPRALLRAGERIQWRSPYGVGRLLLLMTAACIALGGLIIMSVGVTTVFVPEDLQYMGLTAQQLQEINPHLVPLIAHDRAGFGGGLCCCGVTMWFCVWCGQPSRSLWQALLLTGAVGFGTAIGVHPAIGYTTFVHLAPAYLGAAMFAAGLLLTFKRMHRPSAAGSANGLADAVPPASADAEQTQQVGYPEPGQ